jgi:hypothetical protein
MKDHQKQDVIQLAEQIFANLIDPTVSPTDDAVRTLAQASFHAAMIFREAEDEIFGEGN